MFSSGAHLARTVLRAAPSHHVPSVAGMAARLSAVGLHDKQSRAAAPATATPTTVVRTMMRGMRAKHYYTPINSYFPERPEEPAIPPEFETLPATVDNDSDIDHLAEDLLGPMVNQSFPGMFDEKKDRYISEEAMTLIGAMMSNPNHRGFESIRAALRATRADNLLDEDSTESSARARLLAALEESGLRSDGITPGLGSDELDAGYDSEGALESCRLPGPFVFDFQKHRTLFPMSGRRFAADFQQLLGELERRRHLLPGAAATGDEAAPFRSSLEDLAQLTSTPTTPTQVGTAGHIVKVLSSFVDTERFLFSRDTTKLAHEADLVALVSTLRSYLDSLDRENPLQLGPMLAEHPNLPSTLAALFQYQYGPTALAVMEQLPEFARPLKDAAAQVEDLSRQLFQLRPAISAVAELLSQKWTVLTFDFFDTRSLLYTELRNYLKQHDQQELAQSVSTMFAFIPALVQEYAQIKAGNERTLKTHFFRRPRLPSDFYQATGAAATADAEAAGASAAATGTTGSGDRASFMHGDQNMWAEVAPIYLSDKGLSVRIPDHAFQIHSPTVLRDQALLGAPIPEDADPEYPTYEFMTGAELYAREALIEDEHSEFEEEKEDVTRRSMRVVKGKYKFARRMAPNVDRRMHKHEARKRQLRHYMGALISRIQLSTLEQQIKCVLLCFFGSRATWMSDWTVANC
ncbi:hypothetical protein H696_04060 [Fonticula alba]|uniref:Uncharacterized protein n=1 Tax=Fonticula alba TaxID=691883 RepID=A0A058Z5T1_FONAL|nr:hypothetical protein H696_04060 [Fonticula alba]KCV69644.1 hypothetical protein H696_04060 [Fonticula alba]|eukprot:XP_009496209.1 hypothetical protein H696_04060 [Fonticula alba]